MIEHNRPPVRAQSPLFSRIYPAALRAGELACLKRRRQRARADGYGPTDPDVPPIEDGAEPGALPRDTVGLALSGGGIRSATFSLGFLQALAANGLLRHVDFLSTVSGGGYIGSFLGALIQRREPIAAGGLTGIARAEHDLRAPGAQPVRWLRDHGRYMSPNGAGDEIIAGAVYLRNLVSIHLVLATTALVLLGGATLLHAVIDVNRPDLLPHWVAGGVHWSPFLLLPVATLLLAGIPLGWGYWFILGDKNTPPSDLVAAWTAGLVAAAAAAALYARAVEQPALVAAARVLMICPLLALIAWRAGVSAGRRQVDTALDVSVRSKLSQWLATALMITAGCAAFALVDSLGMALYLWLHDNGGRWPLKGGGLMAAVASLIALVGRLAPLLGESQGGRHLSLPKNLLAGVAAAIVFGWIFISLSAFVHFVAWQGKSPDDRALMSVAALAWLTGLTGLLTVLCGRTIRFVNSSSHQALYGNRLTRAYLGASNKKRFTSEGGQRLSDPIQGDNIGWGEYAPHEVGGPLHLVNVTLNETVLGASQVEQRDRKGLPMAVGPCGLSAGLESHALWKQHGDSAGSAQTAAWEGRLPGPSTDWVKPLPREGQGFHLFATPTLEPHRVEALSVGTWTAISGAAFSTGLGARTSLAASLLLGIANVRLGYWWNSHIKPEQREGVRTAPTLRNRMGEQLNAWFPVQVHLIQEFTARFFGPNRERWYLTDGGHFENTACYELLRRRVPFIIASDNGQDASYTFEDLANLVRKARIDLCAEIRFLSRSDIETIVEPSLHGAIGVLDDFRTAEDGQLAAGLARGFARAHALLAHVYYEGAEEPESVMLFIKPTLTGDEPLDVLQYRQQHRAFPQEPTSDQFFDEAQWESYRALGEHIGAELFRPVEGARGWSPSAMIRP